MKKRLVSSLPMRVKNDLSELTIRPHRCTASLRTAFDHEQIVNTILDGLGVIVWGGFMQIVVSRASAVINVGVGMALAFAPVVRLNAANSVLFELAHMQDECGHNETSLSCKKQVYRCTGA